MASHKGFILMYVVALLAAMALILFELGRMQSPAPMYMEKQIAHAIERREAQLLLDFVLAGTASQDLAADPRFLQFKRILAARPRSPSDMEVQLSWLKSVLEQLNFKLEESKPKQGSAGTTEEDAATEITHEGKGILFAPRKEPYRLNIRGKEYLVSVLPGNALPNLNSIGFEPLWRYLTLLNIPQNDARELAAALIDWRDSDEFKTEGLGAESDYYYGMQPPYAPRNAAIRNWQELNYVRGMTPERVRALREGLMLGKPGQTGVSPEFAGPEVFIALTGLREATVRAILKEYGKLDDKNASVSDILLSEDTAAFDRAVSWGSDGDLLRIRIHSAHNTLSADYDVKSKRVTAWW